MEETRDVRAEDRGLGRPPSSRRFRPSHPLTERPPISRPAPDGRVAGPRSSGPGQPREGVAGLLVVALVTVLLLFAGGGAEASFHVLGVLAVYALPVAAVVALWWEDWPGAELRPRWSGLVDTGLVVVGGVVLALLAQAIRQRLDPGALFSARATSGHLSASPALVPLGVAVFTVFLQVTLVTEGWPFRRWGRLVGGAAALAWSWLLGLALERLLLGTAAVQVDAFTGVLGCVSAVQVLGWVVLPGSLLSHLEPRALRLVAGNVLTVGTGVVAYLVIDAGVGDPQAVGALAAGTVGAGLVVGMLFETWPVDRLGERAGGLAAVVLTLALGAVGVRVCVLLADVLGLRGSETLGWSTYALDAVAAAVILHVGIFRRWPVPRAARG